MESELAHHNKRFVLVLLLLALFLYIVFGDGALGDSSGGAAEIPDLPHILSPEGLPKFEELHLEFAGGFPLEMLDDPAHSNVRWYFEEHMHMVGTNSAFQDVRFLGAADLPEDVAESLGNNPPAERRVGYTTYKKARTLLKSHTILYTSTITSSTITATITLSNNRIRVTTLEEWAIGIFKIGF